VNVPADAKALVEAKKELRSEAIEKLERLFVIKALNGSGWSVTVAARNVGMQRPNFHALMRKYGISARDKAEGVEEEEVPLAER
jgi:transcriptional regulator with GAF, ATPase, and Fis domain